MYIPGPKIKWFRRELSRKSGPTPPHRPGYGPTPLKILRDGELFYIGMEYVLANGASKPYKRFSQNFEQLTDAQKYYEKLTAKKIKKLKEFFYQYHPNLHEVSNVEREIILFDFRDVIVEFLEKRGYFERDKTPISLIIKIENFVSDLIQQSLQKSDLIKNREEMGFGIP